MVDHIKQQMVKLESPIKFVGESKDFERKVGLNPTKTRGIFFYLFQSHCTWKWAHVSSLNLEKNKKKW